MLGNRLFDIANLLKETGISHLVVSPGSRNAPLVAALIKTDSFNFYSAPDERSGAFIAMGIAQSLQYPTAFICTSGSALVNAYPAVLESYYQRIPLLIISADRPDYLIDQWDGQTIEQPGIFGRYARSSESFDARNTEFKQITASVFDSVRATMSPIPGPAHLNIALEDPIYQGVAEVYTPNTLPSFVFQTIQGKSLRISDMEPWANSMKVAIVVGQHAPSPLLKEVLTSLQAFLPIFSDVVSSQSSIGLAAWDWGLLKREIPTTLYPDTIITLGTSIISKPLKTLLRNAKPRHLHIGLVEEIGDPFQTNPTYLCCHEADFLQGLLELKQEVEPTYLSEWQTFLAAQPLTVDQIPEPFSSELNWVSSLIDSLPQEAILQFGNSMPIRYASWSTPIQQQVYSNRGVSGIDGCLSTAVGCAIANSDKEIFCILGDITAIYDAHGLWGSMPKNLRLVVFNNGGGRIFDWIDGPNQFPDLRPWIHTPQHKHFKHIADFYGISHARFGIKQVKESISSLLRAQDAVLLELVSES